MEDNMKKTRILALIMVVATLISLLAGCGKTNEQPAATNAPSAGEAARCMCSA